MFPLVGARTFLRKRWTGRKIFPLVTGTFATTDFQVSMLGNIKDRLLSLGYDDSLFSEANRTRSRQIYEAVTSTASTLGEASSQMGKRLFSSSNQESRRDDGDDDVKYENEKGECQESSKETWLAGMMTDQRKAKEAADASKAKQNTTTDAGSAESTDPSWFITLTKPVLGPLIRQVTKALHHSIELVRHADDEQQNVFDNPFCTDPSHSLVIKKYPFHFFFPPKLKG